MTDTDSVDVTYCGPHAQVEVVDYETGFAPDPVKRGGTITVPAAAAKSLLAQGEDNWVAATAKPKTKKKEG